MIISLSGRKRSGKSILANYLVGKGFIKLSFADKLKELVSQLYNWSIESLISEEKDKELNIPVKWDQKKAEHLQLLVNTDKNLFKEETTFYKKREAVVYVGTYVLRDLLDQNYHVDNLVSKIDPNFNYVIDDTRFENELKALQNLNATCFFIMRPYYWETYHNDPSESSLNRSMFKYLLINTTSEKTLVSKMNYVLKYAKNKDKISNNYFLNSYTEESAYWVGLLSNNAKIEKQGKKYYLKITNEKLKEKIQDCPDLFLIDDLKLWNFDINKTNNLPDPIKKNLSLLPYWLLGFLDGTDKKEEAFMLRSKLGIVE